MHVRLITEFTLAGIQFVRTVGSMGWIETRNSGGLGLGRGCEGLH